jgi:hypothetical protein
MRPTKYESLICCGLIAELYRVLNTWEETGRTREGEALWPFPLIWGEAMSYERRLGPRDRYHWVREWAPMALCRVVERTLYVAIRGTGTRHEWSNNARFQQRRFSVQLSSGEYPMGLVHDGFADSFESMWEDLLEAVKDSLAGADRVIVTGHSLGGAIATLAYASLVTRFPIARITKGVVFGCPRVGNPEFAMSFGTIGDAGAFWRYELLHDPVVELPPKSIFGLLRFNHVGEIIVLPRQFLNAAENHAISSYHTAIRDTPELQPGGGVLT